MPRFETLRRWQLRRRKRRRGVLEHGQITRRCYRPVVEPLEPRRLLAATVEPPGSWIYEDDRVAVTTRAPRAER